MTRPSPTNPGAYFAWLRRYLDDAPTPQERAERKAETFAQTYGAPMKLHEHGHAFDTLDADGKLVHHVVDMKTVTGRFNNTDPPEEVGPK